MQVDKVLSQELTDHNSIKRYFAFFKVDGVYFSSFNGKPLFKYINKEDEKLLNLSEKNIRYFLNAKDLAKMVLYISSKNSQCIELYLDFEKNMIEPFNEEKIWKIKDTKVEKWINDKMAPDIINHACDTLNMSQRDLANMMGYAENSFTAWKNKGVMQRSTVKFLETLIELKEAKEKLDQKSIDIDDMIIELMQVKVKQIKKSFIKGDKLEIEDLNTLLLFKLTQIKMSF